MLNRLSRKFKPLLVLVMGLLLASGCIAKAQPPNTNTNTNTSSANTAANTNVNANSNTNTNYNQNQNANDNRGGSVQVPAGPTGPTGTLANLINSYWYKVVVSLLFGFVLIGFAYTIMRAIRFSKFTFNNPLGLPDGSLRAVLAFLLVTFLGFYVFASVMSGTEFKPPDALLGIIATVIGFYFGSRTTTEARVASEAKAASTGSVEGIVLDKAGSPAAGATVDLLQAGNKKFTQTADPNGKVKFDNVPIGNYDIQAALTGQTPSNPAKVKVTAGGAQTVSLQLK